MSIDEFLDEDLERRTELVQTKLKPSEKEKFDLIVESIKVTAPHVTRSSLVRAILCDYMNSIEE